MLNQNPFEEKKYEEIENIIKDITNIENDNKFINIKELANKIMEKIENKIKINEEKKDINLIIMKIEKVLTN